MTLQKLLSVGGAVHPAHFMLIDTNLVTACEGLPESLATMLDLPILNDEILGYDIEKTYDLPYNPHTSTATSDRGSKFKLVRITDHLFIAILL